MCYNDIKETLFFISVFLAAKQALYSKFHTGAQDLTNTHLDWILGNTGPCKRMQGYIGNTGGIQGIQGKQGNIQEYRGINGNKV
jgi:hypothetical protein